MSAALASAKLCTGPSQKNIVSMGPTRLMVTARPAAPAAARSASSTRAPAASSCSYTPGSESTRSVAAPAAMASGLPESVPAW